MASEQTLVLGSGCRSRRVIDISVLVRPDIPLWPGSVGFTWRSEMSREAGDLANVSSFAMDVHVGTHVDAPRHFVDGGRSVDEIGLDVLIGPAWVADLPRAETVGRRELEEAGIPGGTERLLIRTRNSGRLRPGNNRFDPDFVALDVEAARWLVSRGIRLVGIDYLSVQRYHDGPETHHVLLEAEVVILEGLDLSDARQGCFDLVCLPIRLLGLEGAPARAVLVEGTDRP